MAARGTGGGGLAGRLAGDGKQDLLATKRDRKITEMKRRLREIHLGAQREGEAPAERIEARAELRRWCSGGGAVVREERRGGAQDRVEVLPVLYRAKGEGGRA
jgi:hypothetical protein